VVAPSGEQELTLKLVYTVNTMAFDA